MRNLILVNVYLEPGCSQADGEVQISWKPINFMIYSDLFYDMVKEAAGEWLASFKLVKDNHYEAIFEHVVERDGGGAVHSEYFQLVKCWVG